MLAWYEMYLSKQILLFATWTGIRNKQTTGTGSKRFSLSFNIHLIGVNIELVITENDTRYKTTVALEHAEG